MWFLFSDRQIVPRLDPGAGNPTLTRKNKSAIQSSDLFDRVMPGTLLVNGRYVMDISNQVDK